MTPAIPPPRAEQAHDILRHTRGNPLDTIFLPKTVAVIGATETPGSVGCAVLNNLSAFGGAVYPILATACPFLHAIHQST